MTDDLIRLVWVAVLVGLNGFFVAVEFALVRMRERRPRLEQLLAQGSRSARQIDFALKHFDSYIAGAQVGITLASLALGWIGEPAVAHLLEKLFIAMGATPAMPDPHATGAAVQHVQPQLEGFLHVLAIVIGFTTITFLHVVLGEQLPKIVALQKSEPVALSLSAPMRLCVILFKPLIWVLNVSTEALLRLLGLEAPNEHSSLHSVEELQIIVRQSHEAGVLDAFEQRMLQRTFQFSELVASDIMVPRTDMVQFELGTPLNDLINGIIQAPHSRFPIYEDTVDQIVGTLHALELFKYLQEPEPRRPLREILRPALLVPESTHLDALLEQFRANRTHMAVVIDEFGGTAGLITLEDVVEEVFGDLQDALEAPKIQELPEGGWAVDGRVHLHELEDRIGWGLPEDDADTIAGYVMARLGRTARPGDEVSTNFGQVKVTKMAHHRILQVTLHPAKAE